MSHTVFEMKNQSIQDGDEEEEGESDGRRTFLFLSVVNLLNFGDRAASISKKRR